MHIKNKIIIDNFMTINLITMINDEFPGKFNLFKNFF